MKFRIVPFLLVFILLAGAGGVFYYYKKRSAVLSQQKIRYLPELSLKNTEGRDIKLSDFKGKPLIVNMWASWCPFCKEELSSFAVLAEEHKEKIVILAVNRGEKPELVRNYALTAASGTIVFLLDEKDEFYKSVNGFSMPETLFVNEEGIIKLHRRGAMELEEMRRRVGEFF